MSSTARSNDWKKYDKNINESVALEDLRDSIRQQDEKKVDKAIDRCYDAGLHDNEKVKEAADVHLPVIIARNRLNKACKELAEKKGDAEGVKNCLKSIKTDGLSPYLQLEVRDAKIILERHEKKSKEKPRAVSLAMDSKMVAEIRRYQNPPPVLHKVIQAALLLVGEDEDTTDSWKNCQRICNPYGDNSLCRKVVNFDPSKAHPEIVARAKQILQEIEFSEVQSVGRSAPVTFYVWAMGSIEKAEEAAEKKESEENDKNQKEKPAGAKDTTADKAKKPSAPSDKKENPAAPSDKKEKPAAPSDKKENPAAPSDKKEKPAAPSDKKENPTAPSDKKENPAASSHKKENSAAPGDKTSKGEEKKEEKKVKPANRKRQRELLGRLPPPQDDKNFFYNMTVSTKKNSKGKTEGKPSNPTTNGKPSKTNLDKQPPKQKTDEISEPS